MAGKIRDEDIAQVRERTSIVDVISEQVTLKPAGGGNLKGLCPFHDEKTPSFTVSAARNVYFCHGCGAGGDAIRFVMEIDHLTFVESIERLAGRAGIVLRYVEAGPAPIRPQQGQKQRLIAAHAAAATFYAAQLASPAARTAREFLAQRGFDRAAAQRYGCGFAPADWDALVRHLRQQGFSSQEMITGGLAKQARSGSLIDRFRRRLMWPIRDLSGDVIGFGARKLFDDDDGPKYLNTPESPLYKKSHVLYGIEQAKREIAREHRAVIVEGYTDVMACHLAGVPTAVATCGTAFGADHIAVLRRLLMDTDAFAGEIIFTFDGDAAGQKAALRAFEDDQRFVAQTFIAVSPDNMDPCELRLAKGDLAVRDLVARREPLIAFALRSVRSRYDLDTAEGRVGALRASAPLVAKIKDRALRPEYARKLAGDLGMEVDTVVRAVNAAQRHNEVPAGRVTGSDSRYTVSGGRGGPAGSGEGAYGSRGGAGGPGGAGGAGGPGGAGGAGRPGAAGGTGGAGYSGGGADRRDGYDGPGYEAGGGDRNRYSGGVPNRGGAESGRSGTVRAGDGPGTQAGQGPAGWTPESPGVWTGNGPRGRDGGTSQGRPDRGFSTVDNPHRVVEREALKLAIQSPVLAGPMFDAIGAECYGHPVHAAIRTAVAEAGGASRASTGAGWVEAIRAACTDLAGQAMVAELAVEPLRFDGEPDPRYVAVTMARLQLPLVNQRLRELKSKLQRINPVTSRDEYLTLAGDLFSLEQHARALRDQAIGSL